MRKVLSLALFMALSTLVLGFGRHDTATIRGPDHSQQAISVVDQVTMTPSQASLQTLDAALTASTDANGTAITAADTEDGIWVGSVFGATALLFYTAALVTLIATAAMMTSATFRTLVNSVLASVLHVLKILIGATVDLVAHELREARTGFFGYRWNAGGAAVWQSLSAPTAAILLAAVPGRWFLSKLTSWRPDISGARWSASPT